MVLLNFGIAAQLFEESRVRLTSSSDFFLRSDLKKIESEFNVRIAEVALAGFQLLVNEDGGWTHTRRLDALVSTLNLLDKVSFHFMAEE